MIEILDSRFMAEEKLPEISEDFHHIIRTTPIAIHHEDVLQYIPPYDTYSVIANIPYYITSPILFHFLYSIANPPEEMVIMMQEEVGEKILEGRARKPHHSYLSLAMELACEDIEIVRYVGKESFDPAPKVDSIVVKFTVKSSRDREKEEKLLQLWRTAFTHPRKTLISNIRGSPYDIDRVKSWILECGYDEKVRAEAVGLEEWEKLLS
jgi:16S rRNA (adenine1518-N6/adenine1519-N6)-dimethyltransferase